MRKNIKSGYEMYLINGSEYCTYAVTVAKCWKHIVNQILEKNNKIKYSEVRIRQFNNAIKIDAFISNGNEKENLRKIDHGKEKDRPKKTWTIYLGVKEAHYTQGWGDFPYRRYWREWL